MSDYQEAVQNHPLFQEYEKLADFEHVSSADIAILRGLVLDVARTVEPHMKRISQTFQQYTDHDWTHLKNIASHIYAFLPKRINSDQLETVHLNAVELTYLWLAILLHDVGMFVSDSNEKQSILDLEDYREHLHFSSERLELAEKAEAAGQSVAAGAIRDAIFAEFIRRRHAERVHRYIAHNLADKLVFRGADLSTEVGQLCESHGWGVFDSANPKHLEKCVKELDLKKLVGQTPVNLRYLGCCLRLGDILDFDRTRTPMSARQEIHFSEAISAQEWDKHLSIEGVEITTERVAYEAKCKGPDDYVAVQEFLNWVDRELADCGRLIAEFPAEFAERYEFKLPPVVDRWRVKMANPNYVAGAFRFQLEYDQIMKLLMDKSLYPDPSLFLRELLQNSLDACRYQQALATDNGMADKYVPRIQVEDLSSLPHDTENPENCPRIIFRDNGVGMSQEQVENYFLRVGRSYYRSAEFKAERQRLTDKDIHFEACSRFGIGFLSCFLGGDKVEIVTYRYGSHPLRIKIEGQRKYFAIERLSEPSNEVRYRSPSKGKEDGPPQNAGTTVTVWLREGWLPGDELAQEADPCQILEAFAVNQEVAIELVKRRVPNRTIAARRWDAEPFNKVSEERSTCSNFLIASSFDLQLHDDRLRGKGAIWFLSNNGLPTLSKGFVYQDGQSLVLDSFLSSVIEFVEFSQGCNRWQAAEIMELIESRDECDEAGLKLGAILSQHHDYRHAEVEIAAARSKKMLKAMKSSEQIAFVTSVIDALPDLNLGANVWHNAGVSLEAYFEDSLDKLLQVWKSTVVHRSAQFDIPGSFQLALFGVSIPGRMQYWDGTRGYNGQLRWLPNGVSLRCDAYGDLAPEPVASRMYIPSEKAGTLRAVLTRACIEHALSLYQQHDKSSLWKKWLCAFLRSWNNWHLAEGLTFDHVAQMNDVLRARVSNEDFIVLSPRELCERFGRTVEVWRFPPEGESACEAISDTWWLPGYLKRQEQGAVSTTVDLQPLRDALGMD